MPTTFTALSNSNTDVQSAIDGAVAGDTVVIPFGTGNVTWSAFVNVPGKNIKLLGAAGTITTGTLLKISGAAGLNTLIHYTCENTSGFTAEIGNLELFGDMGKKLWIEGVTVLSQVGQVYSKGITVHDIRLSPACNHHMVVQGWVFGVMWHCEINEDLTLSGNETQIINHDKSPLSPVGTNGDYSFFELPAGKSSPIDTLEQWVFEDNIWHHSGACTDTQSGFGGGGRILCRHNTHWGVLAGHGTRESGGAQLGQRTAEQYNNHFLRDLPTTPAEKFISQGPAGLRDGEAIFINNFITVRSTGSFIGATSNWVGISAYGASTVPNFARFNYGADGLNVWDDNQKGDFTDPVGGKSHSVYATYSFDSPVSDPQLFSTDGKSHVVAGVETATPTTGAVFGDVYGTVTGGTYTFGGNPTITGATISGTNLPSDLAGYFDGFIIRNPSDLRTKQNPNCYTFILTSSGTPANATLVVAAGNPAGTAFPLDYTGVMELRKIRNYFHVPGIGQMTVQVQPNSDPMILVDGTKRFVEATPGGIWVIGNMRRIGLGTWQNEIPMTSGLPGGRFYHVFRDFHQLLGPASNYPSVTQGIRPGYPWDKTVAAGPGNPATRVGADFSNSFVAEAGEFASFFVQGAVVSTNVPYPHPLRQAPTSAAPSFTSPSSVTWATGVSSSFNVVATGLPLPSIAASNLPGGGLNASSFAPASPVDGTGTFSWGNPVAGVYNTIQFTAVNIAGTTNQTFTLTVTSPSVTLTSPVNATTFLQPATVNLAATATSGNPGGVTKVEFYQGATLLNAGGDTTAPYSYVWSGMADGTYVLKAKAYDSVGSFESSTVTITVATEVATPTAPASINIRA